MNPPGSLKINGVEYRVAVTDVLKDEYAGVCLHESNVLIIDGTQTKKEATVSFFHEWLHGVEDEFKIKLGHAKINKLEYALTELFEQLPMRKCKCSRKSR